VRYSERGTDGDSLGGGDERRERARPGAVLDDVVVPGEPPGRDADLRESPRGLDGVGGATRGAGGVGVAEIAEEEVVVRALGPGVRESLLDGAGNFVEARDAAAHGVKMPV